MNNLHGLNYFNPQEWDFGLLQGKFTQLYYYK